jgi:hypothetical protein
LTDLERSAMERDRSPRPADVEPEDATPRDATPEGPPSPLEDVDEDVTPIEERAEQEERRRRGDA